MPKGQAHLSSVWCLSAQICLSWGGGGPFLPQELRPAGGPSPAPPRPLPERRQWGLETRPGASLSAPTPSRSPSCQALGLSGSGQPPVLSMVGSSTTSASLPSQLAIFCDSLVGFFLVCLFVLLFRAEPEAHETSWARGQIRATAAGLHLSHSNTRSELPLRPTPELTATLDP